MGCPHEPGVFLTLEECKALFPYLKRAEDLFADPERRVLIKLEKVLYRYLSVQEAETLLYKP
jgi:hypothetical protein